MIRLAIIVAASIVYSAVPVQLESKVSIDSTVPAELYQVTAFTGGCGATVVEPFQDSKGKWHWLAITAAHCAGEGSTTPVKLLWPPSQSRSFSGKVIFADRSNDVAVIEFNPESPVPYAKIGDRPAIGDDVFTVGYPSGNLRGKASTVVKTPHVGDDIAIAEDIWFGNSGGGLFNRSNKLVGVASARSGNQFVPHKSASPSIFAGTFAVGRAYHVAAVRLGYKCDDCPDGDCPRIGGILDKLFGRKRDQGGGGGGGKQQNDYQKPPNELVLKLKELEAEIAKLKELIANLKIPQPNNGKDATIRIGDVRTLPAGSMATVVNTGTPGDAIFNFGIPIGKDGTPGAPGPPGDVVDLSEQLAALELRLRSLEELISTPSPPQPGKESHIVIVADQKADYWPRLSGEIERAKGYYSAIRTAPPPSFSTVLPQLVVYVEGKPSYVSKGVYQVSSDLSRMVRGEFDPVKNPGI